MSISKDIKPVLPYLRRFSRALNGSQEAGDAYLTATLEHLLDNLSAFNREMPTRIALYQLYLDVWSSTHLGETDIHPSDAAAFEHNLAALSPRARQAFLLRTVEGFSVPETAAIMGLDTDRVTRLLERGARDIAQELATKILIIEDEPIIAMDLETIVEDLGHHVVGVARGRRQAVAFAAQWKPELIISDIRTRRRQLGHRRGERHRDERKQASHFHHRLSGPVSQYDRQPARAGVHLVQAFQSQFGQSRGEPGAVLRQKGPRSLS